MSEKNADKVTGGIETMRPVCSAETCTMCGACTKLCPKSCIQDRFIDGKWYMAIDETKCVACGRCAKVCPNLSRVPKSQPGQAYASWASDPRLRRESASGGVAAAIYQWSAENGVWFAGVMMDERFEAHFRLSRDPADIRQFQNSKYTFSFMDNILMEIDSVLAKGDKVVFVGLPCQAAAVQRFVELKKRNRKNLWIVDLVCHGTPLPSHFKEHINAIEQKRCVRYARCSFRDPQYGTHNFKLTLSGNEAQGYVKSVKSDDCFQIGYHNAFIYRTCCYQCQYASRERVSDLTLGDYHGLGEEAPYQGEKEKVSCVLVNTLRGGELMDELTATQRLKAFERPLQEPLRHDPQLNHPSIGGEGWKRFEEAFGKCLNFEEAACEAFHETIWKNRVYSALRIGELKRAVKSVLPASMLPWLRTVRKR